MIKRLPAAFVAAIWVLLTPVMPHLHAHAFGTGSSASVSGLHAAWAHDVPGPVDSEFIAEVEDPRLVALPLPEYRPDFRLRSAEGARPASWAFLTPALPRGPPRAAPQAPQAP